jgi:hypothetical protein
MIKRLLSAMAFLTVCATSTMVAQTDSVRVKLSTSQGAEIGIDGDVSSTNIMTTRVPVGKHTVTVTYGTSYKKDYEIEVNSLNTNFEFYVDGKLTVNSVPAGTRVYIDGMQHGKTPLTVSILGEHNLRVEGDPITYFDYNQRVAVKPFEEVFCPVELKKRPPRTYGMVLLNYEPIPGSSAVGLTMAFVKRWGFYFRLAAGTDGSSGQYEKVGNMSQGYSYAATGTPIGGPGVYQKDKIGFASVSGGLIGRFHKHVYGYAGAGYCTYSKQLKRTDGSGKLTPYGANGALVDAGVILKYKALLGQVGYNYCLGEGVPNKFGSIYIGLGITIHKQRKDR